jgi:diguanylate cyclase (GGDEF)-like protein/PAS domain S-box-containing protein
MLLIDSSTGAIIDANERAVEFYGYTRDELLSMNINEINILSAEQISNEMKEALEEKRNYFEFKHRLKDGTVRDVEVYSSPASNREGNTILFSIIHDITDKKTAQLQANSNKTRTIYLLGSLITLLLIAIIIIYRAKENEKQHKNKFKSLFDNMYEGFALHEIILNDEGIPVDYKFLEVNGAFEKLTGMKLKDIKNKTVKEIMPRTEQYWIDTYGKVALDNETITFTQYSSELNKYFKVSAYATGNKQFVTIFTDITFERNAQEKIEKERKLLELILEDTLSGYWDWDLVSNTEYLSPSFKAMFGYAADEIENKPEGWQKLVFKEDLPGVLELFNEHVASKGEVPFYNEIRYHHKNGSTVWVICSGRVVEWENDRPLRMVGCHINITRIKELERTLIKERNLFKTTLHSIGDGVISADSNGHINIMNTIAEKLTGWATTEATGKQFNDVFRIVNEYTRTPCENPVEKVLETEEIIELENHALLIKKNKEEVPVEDSAAPIRDENGKVTGVVVVFRDCTDKKEKQEKIKYLSYHDQLTGLYNRHFFEEELKRLDTERNLPLTIIMADVNGLKLTNDAFGHATGDLLLQRVAQVMRTECRADDIISRVGGDEFVILLPATSYEEAELVVKRIYRAVSQEKIENVLVSVSIGLKTKEISAQDIKEIYAKAEDDMYRKKITESQSMRNQSVKLIMQTLYEANPREKIHSERVSEISRQIGKYMKLDDEMIKELEVTGLLHDIGKIAIDNNLLNKPDKLTEAEYEDIKRHPEISYQILKSVDTYTRLAECVLSHHERWDGKGYPRKISGEDIPLTARIITVADAYEAMTADRPYKEALMHSQAMQELKRCSGKQFDPEVVSACMACITQQQ